MDGRYSLYEAKAKLSALVKMVREGRSVVITVHGEPVAELRPYAAVEPTGIDERVAELEARGLIVRAERARQSGGLRQLKRVPGALDRFLKDRD